MAKTPASAKPSSAPGTGKGGKRPAWDLKGRLEDMEKMFSQTNARVTDLECEKSWRRMSRSRKRWWCRTARR